MNDATQQIPSPHTRSLANPEVPHTAVIRVGVVVHDNLPDNSLSGRVAEPPTNRIYKITGHNKMMASSRAQEFLARLDKLIKEFEVG